MQKNNNITIATILVQMLIVTAILLYIINNDAFSAGIKSFMIGGCTSSLIMMSFLITNMIYLLDKAQDKENKTNIELLISCTSVFSLTLITTMTIYVIPLNQLCAIVGCIVFPALALLQKRILRKGLSK